MNDTTPMTVFWRIYLLKRFTAENTYDALARRLGLHSKEDIRRLTANYSCISPIIAAKIRQAFPMISIGWLLSGEGDIFG